MNNTKLGDIRNLPERKHEFTWSLWIADVLLYCIPAFLTDMRKVEYLVSSWYVLSKSRLVNLVISFAYGVNLEGRTLDEVFWLVDEYLASVINKSIRRPSCR